MFEVNSPEKLRQVLKKEWSQQVEHMQVPNGTGQGVRVVSVPCQHATPVANVLWKPLISGISASHDKSLQIHWLTSPGL